MANQPIVEIKWNLKKISNTKEGKTMTRKWHKQKIPNKIVDLNLPVALHILM